MSMTLTRPIATRRGQARPAAADELASLLQGWRPMLDALGTNVFVADLQLTIRFANRKAQQTLKAIEPTLRASFGVSAEEIVGGSIHRFHRDPQRVEHVLHKEGFTLPHDAVLRLRWCDPVHPHRRGRRVTMAGSSATPSRGRT
jgi:sensor histidine kinase regulating citrate/malate metabolism